MSSNTQPTDSNSSKTKNSSVQAKQDGQGKSNKVPTPGKGGIILTLSRWLVRIVLAIAFRYFPVNKIKIPQEGPLLVVVNHQSFLDPLLSGAIIPRKMTYFARSSLFKNKMMGALIRYYGAIPVDRGTETSFSGLKRAVEILRVGNAMIMFPDGTRTVDGTIGEYKPGFVWLAQRAKATILPIVISGANVAWNRKNKLPRPYKIRGRVLEPITLDSLQPREGESSREAQTRIANEIRTIMETAKNEMES